MRVTWGSCRWQQPQAVRRNRVAVFSSLPEPFAAAANRAFSQNLRSHRYNGQLPGQASSGSLLWNSETDTMQIIDHWSIVICHLLLGAFVADPVFCFHVRVDRILRPFLRWQITNDKSLLIIVSSVRRCLLGRKTA
jgi:hypothetical protein